MAVMATGNLLTRADLDALPNDGLRHELIDGAFVMTPAPGLPHQTVSGALYRALWSASSPRDSFVSVSTVKWHRATPSSTGWEQRLANQPR